ncbi:hypothetical protein F4818DRAFT_175913 [Hypoxylon cercidicola]|nr:hypothetical protein F4818DRAFT_175913 [Hypoxylon cercidicola]
MCRVLPRFLPIMTSHGTLNANKYTANIYRQYVNHKFYIKNVSQPNSFLLSPLSRRVPRSCRGPVVSPAHVGVVEARFHRANLDSLVDSVTLETRSSVVVGVTRLFGRPSAASRGPMQAICKVPVTTGWLTLHIGRAHMHLVELGRFPNSLTHFVERIIEMTAELHSVLYLDIIRPSCYYTLIYCGQSSKCIASSFLQLYLYS